MKYVFTNGKILNGTREMQVQQGQVILVEDGKITEILPAEEAEKRPRREIRAAGAYQHARASGRQRKAAEEAAG